MLVDARNLTPGASFQCDVCVVGSGPAGIAIVDRLRHSGLDVVLLESGGFDLELPTQQLYRGTCSGQTYFRLDTCRFRLFGGSSNRWGGWCRPLEPQDFERRDWLPNSGWPISEADLAPYYADAAKLFELPNASFDLESWLERLPKPFEFEGSRFQNTLFQFSPQTNFGEVYRSRVVEAKNITTIIHANLTHMALEPQTSRVGALQVAALTGQTFQVRARSVVLATGGIENARLLLASRGERKCGLGNEHDLVGRYFMEHLHVGAGHVLPTPYAANRDFYRKAAYHGAWMRGVLTPTADAQAKYELLGTSIAVEAARYRVGTPFLGLPPPLMFRPINIYRKLRASPLRRAAEAMKWRAERAFELATELRTMEAARDAGVRANVLQAASRLYSLYFRAEQAPDPDNRISLSDTRDALGVPHVKLDWRVKPIDVQGITGWLRLLSEDLPVKGLGTVIFPAEGWEHTIVGGPHHMGTTRMSADPHHGVVDQHCRVHTVDNLYVAGSSIFATAGYANPTFPLVTLALRLADTLQARLR